MATQSWSSEVRHDSDAAFRTWRDELISYLDSMSGLTAVATNVTAGVGTRPGVNTEGGYAVYYLNDSLHATKPIYLRFGFGTFNSVACPRIQVTVAAGHSGGGVMTGATTNYSIFANVATSFNSTVPRQSWMSCSAGFFGLAWKNGSPIPVGTFFLCRSCDSNGDPTGDGFFVHWGNGSSNNITARGSYAHGGASITNYALATTTATGPLGQLAGGITDSNPGNILGGPQVALAWMGIPAMRPIFGMCGVLSDDISELSTVSVDLFGAGERTFFAVPNASGPFGALGVTSSGGMRILMLWE